MGWALAAALSPGAPNRLIQPCQPFKEHLLYVAETCLTCSKWDQVMQNVFHLPNCLLINFPNLQDVVSVLFTHRELTKRDLSDQMGGWISNINPILTAQCEMIAFIIILCLEGVKARQAHCHDNTFPSRRRWYNIMGCQCAECYLGNDVQSLSIFLFSCPLSLLHGLLPWNTAWRWNVTCHEDLLNLAK